MKASEIVKRLQRVESSRTTIESTWDLIERYICPFRGNFFRDAESENSIEWRKPWIYDSTAVMSSQNLASSLHSGITNPISQWFLLRFRDNKLNKNVEAMRWIEECQRRVWETIQESNFTVEINETYTDMVNYGTSVMTEEASNDEAWDGVTFKAVPIKECFFEQDKDGNVMNFYRRIEWTIGQIVDKFGVEMLPVEWRDYYESEGYDPDRKEKIIFCIFRRNDKYKRGEVITKKLAPNNRPYGYKWVIEKTSEEIGESGGYYEMPAFVGRWRKTNDSMWGNSPSMIALSDTMTLQRLIELGLQAIEKAIDPPTMTTQRGLIGDLDLNAGGLTVVRDMNELAPFESKARFDVQNNEIQRLQNNIKDCFFIHQLILPPMQGTPATATEISVRMQQLERIMGATIGRITKDVLDPVIMRTFYMMYREDQLPPMPEVVAQSNATLDIQYMGAMFKTQQASQVANVERWAGMISQLAQINPEVLDVPDWDAIVRGTAQMIGVPADMEKTERDVEQTRKGRAQQQQAMMQAQQAQAAGAGMQAMGEGAQAMQMANSNQGGEANMAQGEGALPA
jgi:hypothetical protein